jgi:cell division protein FtsL
MTIKKRFLVLISLLMFLLLFGALSQQSRNYRLNYTLQKLQKELKWLMDENKEIRISIEAKNNLEFIESHAVNRLNMQFPKKINYIYD